MKIWLDDDFDNPDAPLRRPPAGYTGVHSVNEFKKLILDCEAKGEPIEAIDLDNDLGIYRDDGGEGHDALWWLVETNRFYPTRPHSMNNKENEMMKLTINRFWNK